MSIHVDVYDSAKAIIDYFDAQQMINPYLSPKGKLISRIYRGNLNRATISD